MDDMDWVHSFEVRCKFCRAQMKEVVAGKYFVHWCQGCGALCQRSNIFGRREDLWYRPANRPEKE